MRRGRLLAALSLLVVLVGCSGAQDLPDDPRLTGCLEDAGVDPADLGDVDARRSAFADPAALDCVTGLESPDDRSATLDGVFSPSQLRPVLLDWVATQEGAGADGLARTTGELLGAALGDSDSFTGSALQEPFEQNLAYAVLVAAQGEPASYQVWLDDPDAQASVSQSDPLAATTQYVAWLSDPENGDQQTGEQIRGVQDRIEESREAVVDS